MAAVAVPWIIMNLMSMSIGSGWGLALKRAKVRAGAVDWGPYGSCGHTLEYHEPDEHEHCQPMGAGFEES
eukprot:gene12702-15934_t